MARGSIPVVLTRMERQILELALQGLPIDTIAMTIRKSAKFAEQRMHRGIGKLNQWSLLAEFGSSPRPRGRGWGFLTPRQADRQIARAMLTAGKNWGCVVVLAMPTQASGNRTGAADAIRHHIYDNVRQSDIVTQWGISEWMVFLPGVPPTVLPRVVSRLQRWSDCHWSLFVRGELGYAGATWATVAQQCHEGAMTDYANRTLATQIRVP